MRGLEQQVKRCLSRGGIQLFGVEVGASESPLQTERRGIGVGGLRMRESVGTPSKFPVVVIIQSRKQLRMLVAVPLGGGGVE